MDQGLLIACGGGRGEGFSLAGEIRPVESDVRFSDSDICCRLCYVDDGRSNDPKKMDGTWTVCGVSCDNG